MRIYDVDGNLVLLDNKDITIREPWSFGKQKSYEAVVRAESPGAEEDTFTLHLGTLAECRDFIGILAMRLGDVINLSDVPSTARPEESKPGQQEVNDCPF